MEMGWDLSKVPHRGGTFYKGKTLTTLRGAIIDHFDVGPEDERFAEVAYY